MPIPFTIAATVVTLGAILSSFMKGVDAEGNEKPGTSYFILILACVDLFIRIDWVLMMFENFKKDYFVSFFGLGACCVVSTILNLVIWRKYFHTRYRYDREDDLMGDKLFTKWMKSYPRVSAVLLFVSYVFTFQAIRFTYSRLLSKKMFSAHFSARRRFNRLIGRLSLLEAICLYLPAIGLHVYGLFYIV